MNSTPENTPQPKILVVDDRSSNIVTMRQILGELDCEVFEVLSGEEALRAVMHHDFAVILMDVQMPEMDGYETAKLILTKKSKIRIPIIFVTAITTEPQYIEKAYDVGAVDFLSKPINPTILLSKVEVFLDLHLHKIGIQNAVDELNATQDALLASNQRLSLFSHTVAHDLRNPLSAIMGFMTIMRKGVPAVKGERVSDCVDRVISSADIMHEMLTGILKKADQKSIETAIFETIELDTIMNQVVESLHFKLVDSGGQVNYSDLLPVEADATHMWQLFQNLISNSIKYQRKGVAPVINITTEKLEEKGVVRLVVNDNGRGFSEKDSSLIFERYARLNNADTEDDSYGIGLSTVHQIVQEHSGTISSVGREGEGASFIIELPLTQIKQENIETPVFVRQNHDRSRLSPGH